VPNQRSRFRTIRHVLDELCATHDFAAVVLVGEEGLPLAAATGETGAEAPDLPDPEVIAAVVAQLRMAARTAQRRLGWPELDEVTMMVRGGYRLIARPLDLGQGAYTLAVLVPYWVSYHKAAAQAIAVIQWAWDQRRLG
jgi:predicted regulator of Ras-like GTPase activity (Roadblock/LC7/MglB family)